MLQTALEAVAPGGRVVQVGLGEDRCCVPTMQAVFKEVEFTGSWRYTNTVNTSAPFYIHLSDKLYENVESPCDTVTGCHGAKICVTVFSYYLPVAVFWAT